MSNPTSLLKELLQAQPHLRTQMYFKSSLVALSHAMEDQVLAGQADQPLVIASFQRERYYRQEAHRYLRIAERTDQVYVLAAPETDFRSCSERYEMVAFDPTDGLSQEWHLVVVSKRYAVCLICQEHPAPAESGAGFPAVPMDQARRFEGIWTFDRQVTCEAARLLLGRILTYQPRLTAKVEQALAELDAEEVSELRFVDPGPFAERLATYLQAGQYKLLKAYRSIAAQERKERLVNSMSSAIRRSLNSEEIFKVAVQELGQALQSCRCLIYPAQATDKSAILQHEFVNPQATSLVGQVWPLQDNPLFQEVVQTQQYVHVEDTRTDLRLAAASPWQALMKQNAIHSLVIVPVLYQGRLLGVVELHHCRKGTRVWDDDELSLVEAIATQVGAALIQAEAYAELQELNQQLEALERTRSNLIAVTGHELRTPLSTIQVCLESLAEPDLSPEVRQVMLSTALADAERMRTLIQDFLTLSRLESGRIEWHSEPLPLKECVDLAISGIQARRRQNQLPHIKTQVPPELPLVQADGEWLVEVFSKLLENACKFTDAQGEVTVQVERNGGQM
ncbi:MAG TPA: DICT sensory domain-containing protein, partial [Candidatus Caenarcaniphilales bacterium]